MGAVTTASNSTSWTNSSSPKEEGEQESGEKYVCPTRCLRYGASAWTRALGLHGTKRDHPLQGREHDLPSWMEESRGRDVTAKIATMVPV